jgi:hypothetical protein
MLSSPSMVSDTANCSFACEIPVICRAGPTLRQRMDCEIHVIDEKHPGVMQAGAVLA